MTEPKGKEVKQSIVYTFQYDTDQESIDLNAMLASQYGLLTAMSEIKNYVAKDAKLSIRVKPMEKGSVPFEFLADLIWYENLFNNAVNAVNYAYSIITLLTGILVLKGHLSGKKAQNIEINGDIIVVTNSENITINVSRQVYEISKSNSIIDTALTKSFEAIEKDESISGVKMIDSNKNVIYKAGRNTITSLSKTSEEFTSTSTTEVISKEPLSVVKIVFEPGYKWQFYFRGHKISADIKDDTYMEKINKGQRFSKGDTIIADLEIHKEFDESVNAYLNKSYTVTKVHSHTPRSTQSRMFGLTENE